MLEFFTILSIVAAVLCSGIAAIFVYPALDDDDVMELEDLDDLDEVRNILWDCREVFYPAIGFTILAIILVVKG